MKNLVKLSLFFLLVCFYSCESPETENATPRTTGVVTRTPDDIYNPIDSTDVDREDSGQNATNDSNEGDGSSNSNSKPDIHSPSVDPGRE